MTKQTKLLVVNELLWISIALVVTLIVLLPLFNLIKSSYLIYNASLIIISVFYFRYTINIHKVVYLTFNKSIYIFTVFNLAYLVYFIVSLQEYLYEADNYVLNFFLITDLTLDTLDISETFNYFKKEFLFFNVSFALLTVSFQLRLMSLLWKTLKK